jgi:hypothetical protein
MRLRIYFSSVEGIDFGKTLVIENLLRPSLKPNVLFK